MIFLVWSQIEIYLVAHVRVRIAYVLYSAYMFTLIVIILSCHFVDFTCFQERKLKIQSNDLFICSQKAAHKKSQQQQQQQRLQKQHKEKEEERYATRSLKELLAFDFIYSFRMHSINITFK